MYKIFRVFLFSIFVQSFFITSVFADSCFVAKESGKIVKQLGKCNQRHSPFSTFKIPLALMGFDSGVLKSAIFPKVEYDRNIETNYVTYYNPERYPVMLFWKRAQTPESWMRESVVWYSRYITHKLGINRFKEYLHQFDYGNYKDIQFSDDSLMNSWLMGSIEISPLEQVAFIDKLLRNKLSVSANATTKTLEIIKLEKIFDGWQLYGKSGGAIELGWFVGLIKKGNRTIIFAQYI